MRKLRQLENVCMVPKLMQQEHLDLKSPEFQTRLVILWKTKITKDETESLKKDAMQIETIDT